MDAHPGEGSQRGSVFEYTSRNTFIFWKFPAHYSKPERCGYKNLLFTYAAWAIENFHRYFYPFGYVLKSSDKTEPAAY